MHTNSNKRGTGFILALISRGWDRMQRKGEIYDVNDGCTNATSMT